MNGVQTVRNFVIWPNPRAGKIKRILCSYWQPKPFLLSRDISHWSRKKNVLVLAMINPLLTKLVQSRYLDIGLVLFCVFIDLDFFSVHKKTQKNGQYPAILTSRLLNNAGAPKDRFLGNDLEWLVMHPVVL